MHTHSWTLFLCCPDDYYNINDDEWLDVIAIARFSLRGDNSSTLCHDVKMPNVPRWMLRPPLLFVFSFFFKLWPYCELAGWPGAVGHTVAGCWMLDVGCWMLDVGCWMLNVVCCMLNGRWFALDGAWWMQCESEDEHHAPCTIHETPCTSQSSSLLRNRLKSHLVIRVPPLSSFAAESWELRTEKWGWGLHLATCYSLLACCCRSCYSLRVKENGNSVSSIGQNEIRPGYNQQQLHLATVLFASLPALKLKYESSGQAHPSSPLMQTIDSRICLAIRVHCEFAWNFHATMWRSRREGEGETEGCSHQKERKESCPFTPCFP